MYCSLDKLVKNLIDEDFKYLSEKYSCEQLKLVKEKGIYPFLMNTRILLRGLMKIKYLIKITFLVIKKLWY